jgi:hypothetical protein
MDDEQRCRFTMLGIVHRDLDGIPLLERWLKRNKPDVITLEHTHYGLRFRQLNGGLLKSRVNAAVADMTAQGIYVDRRAVADLLAYIDPSFEYAVVHDYAAHRGIPLYLIDMERFSRTNLTHMDELVSRENLNKLLSGPVFEGALREKAFARLYFKKGMTLVPYSPEMGLRDRYMSNRIKELMGENQHGHFLHVCGWQHLKDPDKCYGRLNPHKVFLYDD